MATKKDGMNGMMEAYEGFLNERKTAKPAHRKHMARWVRQVSGLFRPKWRVQLRSEPGPVLASLDKHPYISKWQAQQAGAPEESA